MSEVLEAIFERRAIKEFDAVPIPQEVREQIWRRRGLLLRASTSNRTGSIGWKHRSSEKTLRGFAWAKRRRNRRRR